MGVVEGLGHLVSPGGVHRAVRSGHPHLEGLARVAQLVGRAQLGVGGIHLLAAALAEPRDDLGNVLPRQVVTRKQHALNDVAPALGDVGSGKMAGAADGAQRIRVSSVKKIEGRCLAAKK